MYTVPPLLHISDSLSSPLSRINSQQLSSSSSSSSATMQVAEQASQTALILTTTAGAAAEKAGDAHAPPPWKGLEAPYATVQQMAASNAVVVFSTSGCCMCTVAERLLFGLGVGPTIVEIDKINGGGGGGRIEAVLSRLLPESSGQKAVPAIFIGGKFLGGVETLMSCHINGTLVPLLKNAGALWL